MAAKKSATSSTKRKVDFSDSLQSVKETANTVQHKVKKTAKVVVDDVRENGKQLSTTASTKAKQAYENLAETNLSVKVAQTAKQANAFALQTAEEAIEGMEQSSEKWQDISKKAIKGGAKLATKQQEIMFDTLEAMRDQLAVGSARFQKLFPFATRKNVMKATEKGMQKVKEEVRERVPQVKAKVNGAIQKAKEGKI